MRSIATLTAGARGGGITVLGSIASMLIQLASVAILSRLLQPADFGLVAMVGVFVALGVMVRDFGMPMAALQARGLSHQQASNLFWLNTLLAASASVGLVMLAPVLAGIYSEPRLAAVVPFMALTVLIGGLGAQFQIDLARRMKFFHLALIEVLAQALGLGVASLLAVSGIGYWALIAQALTISVVGLVLRVLASRWRPSRFRRGHGSREHLRAGAQYGFAHLLTFLQTNADTFIIGAALGAGPLGYYNRAYQLLTAPMSKILDPLTQVVVPTLNRIRDERNDLHVLMLRAQFAAGSSVVWIFSMAAATASETVPLLLGRGWEPSIRIFQILALGGGIWVFSYVSYWVFVAHLRSRDLLRYNLVSKPFAVACIGVGSLYGIEGVAWGYVLAMSVSWPLNLLWLRTIVGLPAALFARNGVSILVAGGAAGLLAAAICVSTSGMPAPLSILVAVAGGTLVYAGALWGFPWCRPQLHSGVRLLHGVVGLEPGRS